MTEEEFNEKVKQGKDPNFLRKISNLFSSPVIAIQLTTKQPHQEKEPPTSGTQQRDGSEPENKE